MTGDEQQTILSALADVRSQMSTEFRDALGLHSEQMTAKLDVLAKGQQEFALQRLSDQLTYEQKFASRAREHELANALQGVSGTVQLHERKLDANSALIASNDRRHGDYEQRLEESIKSLRGEIAKLSGEVTSGWRTNGGYVVLALISLAGIVVTYLLAHGGHP